MASNKRAAQGAGNIRKHVVMRDGQSYTYWEARVTVGTDAVTGKPVRRPFSGKTQKEVREKMQAAAVAVNDGDYFEPSKMTLARWLDIWLIFLYYYFTIFIKLWTFYCNFIVAKRYGIKHFAFASQHCFFIF